jgi:hypothetical protein
MSDFPFLSGTFGRDSSGAATGIEGWPIFDSAKALPESRPTFTVRYPPAFTADEGRRPLNLTKGGEFIQNMYFRHQLSGVFVLIEMSRSPLPAGSSGTRKDIMRLTRLSGSGIASAAGASFDGVVPVAVKGCAAADSFFTMTAPDADGKMSRTFTVLRSVYAGKALYAFSCLHSFPAAVAEERGYTSKRNPIILEWGFPLLNSIAFRL